MTDLRYKIADYLDSQTLEPGEDCLSHADTILDMIAEEPAAGTHAYDLIAAAALAEVEVTDTLMQMLAATVLMAFGETMKIEDRPIAVSYSPIEMARMTAEYEMSATKDGLITTVQIRKRETPVPSVMTQDEDVSNAKPQAQAKVYTGEHWVIFLPSDAGWAWAHMLDQADAERNLKSYLKQYPLAAIQNRHCLHHECPSTGCTKEVTSEVS